MPIQLPPLAYAYDALEPHMSRRTLEFHHDKHHRAYVDKTNELAKKAGIEGDDLVAIIRAARERGDQALLNQAGQAWNHGFFWPSLSPSGGGAPTGRLAQLIDRDLGGLEGLRKAFAKEGAGHFASGWAWLVLEGERLKVTSYHDGDTPAGREGITPLLTCDLWEHAYYLDYQNRRPDFLKAFLEALVNWDFADENLPDVTATRGEARPAPPGA